MASRKADDLLTCPYCRFRSRQYDALERHVQRSHPPAQQQPSMAAIQPQPQPAQHHDSNAAGLSDFEMAQLLAFEEAGLPAELAFSEDTPSRKDNNSLASTTGDKEVHDSSSLAEEGTWVQCICGERVHVLELDAHSDMHAQENISIDEPEVPVKGAELTMHAVAAAQPPLIDHTNGFATDIPRSLRNYDQINPSKHSSNQSRRRGPSIKDIFLGTPASPKRKSGYSAVSEKQGRTKRLGRSELGPYAHETQMPAWLRRMLEDGAKATIVNKIGPDGTIQRVETVANETPNLVPVLARFSHLDRTVERAFYCSHKVRHVCKMHKEGGFCGYRNIQMVVSYIQEANAKGADKFPGRLPSILKLQELIETAWDKGINSSGRQETGGILYTRKYIGTPEAQALFQSLNIPCEATAFTTTNKVEGFETMLVAVCEYFDDESSKDSIDKVVLTDKPPIYFQHRGHSMTIVGVEQRLDSSVNLIVFDPMFNPSAAMKKLALANNIVFRSNDADKLLKAYRRGEKYLEKYKEFELLKLK